MDRGRPVASRRDDVRLAICGIRNGAAGEFAPNPGGDSARSALRIAVSVSDRNSRYQTAVRVLQCS